jgi:FkbM family methyltransferase
MNTVEVTYAGRAVALPDLPDYRKFYRKLAAGTWEPRTFEVLARNLDGGTVYVDIGAWIGVTPFWASALAKRVIAVEPDPACIAILEALAPACRNVTILHGALSPDPEVTLHAVDGFGSSETTALDLGEGERAAAQGLSLARIMAGIGQEPVFVKIDIEGYEFLAIREIAGLRGFRLRGLQLAVHPQLYERSLAGSLVWRRLRTLWATWRLCRLLRGLFPPPAFAKYRSVASYLVLGVLFRRAPKGADLVFERRPSGASKGRS